MDFVGGIDGCRGGWVLVTAPAGGEGGEGKVRVEVIADLAPVIERIETGDLAAVAIDIPIGLPDRDPRPCDLGARRLIGPRASSVFPAPLRDIIDSISYEEACSRSFAICGKRLSRQGFAILPKIKAVDAVMTPSRQTSIVEMHPEVSFTVLAGQPMSRHKSTRDGRLERLRVLHSVFADIDHQSRTVLARSAPDDVLDAFVAAWSARRWLASSHRQLGGDLDRKGLRMEMIA